MSQDEEIFKVRDRVHKLSDIVQTHTGTLGEHRILIDFMREQITALSTRTASREQLDAAMAKIAIEMTAAVTLLTEKISNVQSGLDPIRKALYWAVGLIIGAFILAVVALVIKQ